MFETESQMHCLKKLAAVIGVLLLVVGGCKSGNWNPWPAHPAASPLGTFSDPVWQNQEYNAERSDFVIHEHEFVEQSEFLNTAGEDHLRQIAFRIFAGHDGLVLVERSRHSARPDTQHKYPVHPNPDLDLRRREVVVRCLLAMQIHDADAIVVVAPDLAPQYRAGETAATYYHDGLHNRGNAGWGSGDAGGGGQGGGYGW